jgi:hypothetical protein
MAWIGPERTVGDIEIRPFVSASCRLPLAYALVRESRERPRDFLT